MFVDLINNLTTIMNTFTVLAVKVAVESIPVCVIFAPLVGGLAILIFGRLLSRTGAIIFVVLHIFSSLSCVLYLFVKYAFSHKVLNVFLYKWLDVGLLDINIALCFNSLTITMLTLILTISFLVHLYSVSYMRADPYQITFFAYLSLFTFFMLFLVVSENLVMFFFGREGVGLCSYLLINFWTDRVQANKSAIKAMLVNRVGDVILLIGIAFIFNNFGTFDFDSVFNIVHSIMLSDPNVVHSVVDSACLFLLAGSVAKSAQLGLHSWLPDAMEGPTPVSALIHAATMVTAGVFLILKCSALVEYAPTARSLLVIFGALTCLYAGAVGSFQVDVKKLIAYSTMGQLGYMYLGCGLSCYNEAFFHLWIHGFVKALLFLGIGIIIHNMGDEQNMFRMGGLFHFFPVLGICILIATLSMLATPFLSGYYSKHIMLEMFYYNSTLGYFGYWAGVLGSFFTGFYSLKLVLFVFFGPANWTFANTRQLPVRENSFFLYAPIYILAVASIVCGGLFYPIFVDIGSTFFSPWLYVHSSHALKIESENLGVLQKWLPTLVTFLGVLFAHVHFHNINYRQNRVVKLVNATVQNMHTRTTLNALHKAISLALDFLLSFFRVIHNYPYNSLYVNIIWHILSPFIVIAFIMKLIIKILIISIASILWGIVSVHFVYSMYCLFLFYRLLFYLSICRLTFFNRYALGCLRLIYFASGCSPWPGFMLHIILLRIPPTYYLLVLQMLIHFRNFILTIIELSRPLTQFHLKIWYFDLLTLLIHYSSCNWDMRYQVPMPNNVELYSELETDVYETYWSLYNCLSRSNVSRLNLLNVNITRFASRGIFFDKFVNEFLVRSLFSISWSVFFKTLDKGIYEYIGPVGISRLCNRLSSYVSNFQTGFVFDYVCTVLLGVIVLVCSILVLV